jgi:murein DD-endopeptidase MepM/ murein hydrolase activator NlpD
MTKRKLLIGLASAGILLAGFGGSVLPASADRTYVVTLASGQTMRVVVPDGKTLADVVPGPVATATEIASTPQPPAPAPEPGQSATGEGDPAAPAGEQPPAAEQPPAPVDGQGPGDEPKADEPTGGRSEEQATTRAGKPRPKREASRKDKRDRDGDEERDRDRAPSPDDPTFSLALPGPAPIGVPNFFIDKFRIPPFLLPIYQAAGIEYGVRWEILAAINEIETDYGRNLNVSTAGAVGWMQFLPSTWKTYGTDANNDGRKDPYNPVDAIFAAARYLKAAGAETDIRRAIFAYNHADWYVESVLLRARLIGGLPTDLVGSLTGLTQGHFPVHAKARYADDLSEQEARRRVARGQNAAVPIEGETTRRGIRIFARPNSPAVAVQDGKIVGMGTTERLGQYVKLRDVYGNTYTYGHLGRLAEAHPVPRPRTVSRRDVAEELDLPARDPRPTVPATAGSQAPAPDEPAPDEPARPDAAADAEAASQKERLFANPQRPAAFRAGGEEQLLERGAALGSKSFRDYFTQLYGLRRSDVALKPLEVGSRVIAGTILGRLGRTSESVDPHLLFEVRPAGRGAPRIDPKPILDGWKLLESTAIYRAAGKNPFFGPDAKNPSIGQILMMSKEALQRRVLEDARIELYECGRRDVRAGIVDRRVLATLEFLATSGLRPSVTSLRCGHGYLTASGNVSAHSSGNAVDIAKINGVPIIGNQGEGSITEIAIRRLLTLQGTLKPDQIISLMTFEGADNTLALSDHADHIHVGFQPLYGANSKLGRQLNSVLKPGQWIKLIDRLGEIDNPTVRVTPSKYSIKVKRASRAHVGD